jgi:hypothetical protein
MNAMIIVYLSATDLCIESLVVRGAIVMSKFLQGQPSDCFAWLNPSSLDEDRKQLVASSKTRLCSWTSVLISSVLMCVVGMGGLMSMHGKSSGDIRELLVGAINGLRKDFQINAFGMR